MSCFHGNQKSFGFAFQMLMVALGTFLVVNVVSVKSDKAISVNSFICIVICPVSSFLSVAS